MADRSESSGVPGPAAVALDHEDPDHRPWGNGELLPKELSSPCFARSRFPLLPARSLPGADPALPVPAGKEVRWLQSSDDVDHALAALAADAADLLTGPDRRGPPQRLRLCPLQPPPAQLRPPAPVFHPLRRPRAPPAPTPAAPHPHDAAPSDHQRCIERRPEPPPLEPLNICCPESRTRPAGWGANRAPAPLS